MTNYILFKVDKNGSGEKGFLYTYRTEEPQEKNVDVFRTIENLVRVFPDLKEGDSLSTIPGLKATVNVRGYSREFPLTNSELIKFMRKYNDRQ